MEDSFKVRLDKAFGSLAGDAPGEHQSLWLLTGGDIETSIWSRTKEGDHGIESRSSVTTDQLEPDVQERSDYQGEADGDIDGMAKKRRRDDHSNADEYLDIQSSIAADSTLDYEEDEDVYDKMATGNTLNGDGEYVNDVKATTDTKIDECSACDKLPNSIRAFFNNPLANREAAKMRLDEDAEAAGNFDTLHLTDNSATPSSGTEQLNTGEASENHPKPILKKRKKLTEPRSQKRVRFMIEEDHVNLSMDDNLARSPKSITYRRKPDDASSSMKSSKNSNATEDDNKNEGLSVGVTAIEEAEPSTTQDIHKPSRQYQVKGQHR